MRTYQTYALLFATLIKTAFAQPRPAHLEIQMGNAAGISDVRFSSNNRLLLTVGAGRACLWDLESGKELRCFTDTDVDSATFSPTLNAALIASKTGLILRDINTGDELRAFGNEGAKSGVFSPDGSSVAAAQGASIHIWEVSSGKETGQLHDAAWAKAEPSVGSGQPSAKPFHLSFARLHSWLVTCTETGQVALWDRASGQLTKSFMVDASLESCDLSSDDKTVATASMIGDDIRDVRNCDIVVKTFSVSSGTMLWSRRENGLPRDLRFSADSQSLFFSGMRLRGGMAKIVHILESQEGIPNLALERQAVECSDAFFDENGKQWAIVGQDGQLGRIVVRAMNVDKTLVTLESKVEAVAALCWNGKAISAVGRSTWSTLDVQDGHISQRRRPEDLRVRSARAAKVLACLAEEPQFTIPAKTKVYLSFPSHDEEAVFLPNTTKSEDAPLAVSANGRFIAYSLGNAAIHIADLVSANETTYATGHPVTDVLAMSATGRYVFYQEVDDVSLIDLSTKKPVYAFRLYSGNNRLESAAFFQDELLAFSTGEGKVGLYSLSQRALLWERKLNFPLSMTFSADGHLIGTCGFRSPNVVDATTGEVIQTFNGHTGWANSIAFSPDGKMAASAGPDGTIRFWDVATGKELVKYVSLKDQAWAVVDPAGRYDASDSDGVDGLHWVVDTEPISLRQLKQRFYVPGLLAKVVRREKLPDVADLHLVDLFPSVEYNPPAVGSTKLELTLTSRGGGIGRIKVLVNGKEIVADARGPAQDLNAPAAHLTIDLAGAPVLPGERNVIDVISSNARGYLESRGFMTEWIPPGASSSAAPELYAIVIGISEYRDTALRLRYSAKDANDMVDAVQLAAKRLFGAERVHLTALESPSKNAVVNPTKLNIQAAFESARNSKPGDILFVYFSGHAVTLGNGQDRYCYLTVDGHPGEFNDPIIRDRSCITSDELGEWMTKIPALKQVLILDTCAAGAVANRFTVPRDVGADQIRAMELLKDRTGVHILMGSAADAVSYEANQYGQGLLTFSLLEAMRGAALKDGRYVDVSTLFNWATDRVPMLAKDIGGIQRPLITAPKGTSFPIGMVLEADKEHIPLARIKPEILRPILQNATELYDDLKLTAAVRDRLRDLSEPVFRGAGPDKQNIVYLDVDESLPGAILPRGVYRVEGKEVGVTIRLIRDGAPMSTIEVQGMSTDLPGLAELICTKMLAAIAPPK